MPQPKSESPRCSCGSSLHPDLPGPFCPACRYRHWLQKERLRRSRLPPQARHQRFSNFITTAAHRRKVETLRSSDRSFYLYGKTGCGKTHLLAAAIFQHLDHQQEAQALYLDWPGYLQQLKESFLDSRLPPLYYQTRQVDLLALDDLSILRWSSFATEQFYLLIEQRLKQQRRTLLAALVPPQRLTSNLPDFLLSRLQFHFSLLELPPRDARRHPYPRQKSFLET